MDKQDPVASARLQWMRLVLGRGRPVFIVVVLVIVGTAICWFSLQKIVLLTQAPTRYTLELEVATEGCDDGQWGLEGDIGSTGPSFLQFRFLDNDQPVFVGECRVRSILLRSNLSLQPVAFSDDSHYLIGVRGADLDDLMEGNDNATPIARHVGIERFLATIIDEEFRTVDRPDTPDSGPSFSVRVQDQVLQTDYWRPFFYYEVTFPEGWQPIAYNLTFAVPDNVRTYFDLFGVHFDEKSSDGQDPATDGGPSVPNFRDLDISVSFRTDEVLLVRGAMSESGDAIGVNGFLRFGIENSDAESRREGGNVRFSAILGIGIALLVEAFVILLAIVVRAIALRLGIADEPFDTAE